MTSTQEQALIGTYPELILGGKAYPVSLTFNGLAEIEQLTGRNFLNRGAWDNINFALIKALVYCCVKRFTPEVSLDGLGKHITLQNSTELIPVCMMAIQGKGGTKREAPLEITPHTAKLMLVKA